MTPTKKMKDRDSKTTKATVRLVFPHTRASMLVMDPQASESDRMVIVGDIVCDVC